MTFLQLSISLSQRRGNLVAHSVSQSHPSRGEYLSSPLAAVAVGRAEYKLSKTLPAAIQRPSKAVPQKLCTFRYSPAVSRSKASGTRWIRRRRKLAERGIRVEYLA